MDLEQTYMGQCMKKLIDPQGPEELLTFFGHLRGHAKVPGNRSNFLRHCQHRLTRCILLESIVAKRMMRKFPERIPPKFKNLCRMYSNIKVTSTYVDNRVFIGDEEEVRRRNPRTLIDSDFKTTKVEQLLFHYRGEYKFCKLSKPPKK